jgi:hypothetical protein
MHISSHWILLFILSLIFIIFICLGVIAYLLYKRKVEVNKEITVKPQSSPDKEKKAATPTVLPPPNESGICAICEEAFHEKELFEHEKLHFCRTHYQLILNYEWKVIKKVISNANSPEAAISIYQTKQQLWNEKDIPSYIATHYKIDIDENLIESHVLLLVREQDEEVFKTYLEQ